MAQQSVIFSVGEEEYGIPINVVREIVRIDVGRTIPQAPDYVKGLITLRGQAIPIIDLHVRFGVGENTSLLKTSDGGKAVNQNNLALIVELNGNLVGFAVDNVQEVRVLDNIAPPPPLVTASFIGGVVNLPDRIIMELMPEHLLEDSELQGLSRLASA